MQQIKLYYIVLFVVLLTLSVDSAEARTKRSRNAHPEMNAANAAMEPSAYTTSIVPDDDVLAKDSVLTKSVNGERISLPVSISQTHEHVFKYWITAAENKVISRSGNTLVHFDSHPDFGVPRGLFPDSWPEFPASLEKEEKITLSDFILAGVWIGLIDRVIWVYPDWSYQIEEMWHDYNITLGRDFTQKKSKQWKVDFFVDYFLSSNDSLEVGLIEQPKSFWFRSVPFSKLSKALEVDLSDESKKSLNINEIKSFVDLNKDHLPPTSGYKYGGLALPKNTSVIVDIDEDFFATVNLQMFMMQSLTKDHEATKALVDRFLYMHMCFGSNYKEHSHTETVVKNSLGTVISHHSYQNISDFMVDVQPIVKAFCDENFGDITMRMLFDYFHNKFLPSVPIKSKFDKLVPANWQKFLLVASSIQACTTVPQAKDISSQSVRFTLAEFQNVLKKLLGGRDNMPSKSMEVPKVVTVARSVIDGFLPRVHWPVVESGIIDSINGVYGNSRRVQLMYDTAHDVKEAPVALECGSVKYISKQHGISLKDMVRDFKISGVDDRVEELENVNDWCKLEHDHLLELWIDGIYQSKHNQQYAHYADVNAPYPIPVVKKPFDLFLDRIMKDGFLEGIRRDFASVIDGGENESESESSSGDEEESESNDSEGEYDSDSSD